MLSDINYSNLNSILCLSLNSYILSKLMLKIHQIKTVLLRIIYVLRSDFRIY
jgi:hypothetical protein